MLCASFADAVAGARPAAGVRGVADNVAWMADSGDGGSSASGLPSAPGHPQMPQWPAPSPDAAGSTAPPPWPAAGAAPAQEGAGAAGAAPLQGPLGEVPPPRTRGDGWLWLVFALAGFVVGQIGAVVATEIAAAIEGKGSQLSSIANLSVPPEWYVVSSLLGLWIGFGGAPWLASRVRGTGRFVADLGIRFRWIDLAGILIGVGGQFLVVLLYAPFIKHLHNFDAPTKRLTGGAHGGGFAVIALFTVLGAPFFEELFFRGLLFRALCRVFTPSARRAAPVAAVVAAVVVDGLLFGLAHAEWEQFAGLAAFGAILAVVAYRTRRLGMNMVAHATFNLVAVLAILSSR
jgi:uncharacterized protein